MKESFGEKLKTARTQKGFTQYELAKKLKVTNGTISNWENNISKPDLDLLCNICGVLNVKADFFLEADPPIEDLNSSEFEMIEKYRLLDSHGKKIVDFVLNEEWRRSAALSHHSNYT